MAAATLQSFNAFLTERLSSAAVEIYGFVERTLLDCQEDVYRTKLENQRLQRLLDLVYQPEIKLHRADSKQPTVEISSKQQQQQHSVQEWSPSQEDPGPSQIKEEDKRQLWTNGNAEQPSAEDGDEADTKELIRTVRQLENSTAADESREPKLSVAEDPDCSEAKTSTTFYRCHVCNYIFTEKAVLTWHLKTHGSKGNLDCHVCGKHLPCQSNLQNHMRRHTGERPYRCHICGKCFRWKGHVTEHIRIHTGEKPFSCHVCDRSFIRSSSLKKHRCVKHKETVQVSGL